MEENTNILPNDINDAELPWLIFTLNGNAYAINSKFVDAIEMIPEHITPLPDAPDLFCGLVERRGEVYPLLDMRKVFHFPAIDDEVDKFNEMMEQRKQDHTNWVKALEDSVENGTPFKLSTDPHKCAFGMWYDKFIADNHVAGTSLRKVEEPHKLLHEAAPVILEAAANGDTEKAEELLKKVRENYYPKVMEVLDEAEHAYRSTFREIVVVLSDGEQMLGLRVDEVLAVDKIEPVNGSSNINLLLQSRFFDGTARNDKIDEEILIVNEKELFRISSSVQEKKVKND